MPKNYDGTMGEGKKYSVFISPTGKVFILVRGFLQSAASVESITIRPLNGDAEPMKFRPVSDIPSSR